jgi:hypothetical protein
MTTYQPFSNATEAGLWLQNNCGQCHRGACQARTLIESSGDIPEKLALKIGATLCYNPNHLHMPDICHDLKEAAPVSHDLPQGGLFT